jgi:hypothetical protein
MYSSLDLNEVALMGIIEGMTLMYAIGLLKELYREHQQQSKRKEVMKMLKSAVSPIMTSTNYV